MAMRLVIACLGMLGCAAAAAAQAANGPTPLRAVVLLADAGQLVQGGWREPAAGVDASRVTIPGTELLQQAIQPFIGKPLTMPALEQVRERVGRRYAAAGRPFVSVSIPPQDATNGVVQVVVVEGRLGELRIEGAKHFAESDYRKAVGLSPGERIDAARLDRTIRQLNENPYRRVTPVALAGSAPGSTDIVLQAQEALPLRIAANAGNNGNPRNGEHQVGGSAEWGNAFGRGDLLNVRYTTSTDRVINQYGLGYTANLPWQHAISITANYATTRPDARGSAISTEGASSGVSLRYAVSPRRFADRLAIGVDYRRTDNDVLFGGESIFATAAVVAQATVDYSKSVRSLVGMTTASVNAIYSPGEAGSRNTDAVFEQQRQGATARYAYARVSIGHAGLLPWGFSWDLRATGQLSSARLLSTEQLGFGGDGSLRGFNTFAANRDEGAVANAEVRFPSVRGMLIGKRDDANADDLSLFVFGDYGAGRQHGEDIGPLRLASVGPGLRYQVGRFGSVQVAYGRVLQSTGLDDSPRHRVHFQLNAGF